LTATEVKTNSSKKILGTTEKTTELTIMAQESDLKIRVSGDLKIVSEVADEVEA
jgi:hypothetical protein